MNQYRCETCEHMKTHTSKGGLPFEERCEVSGYPPRDKIFENKLACVGCASHSDFQSERDKVLERLHIWFENYCEGNEEADLWMAFIHAERTLRQQQGDPR